MRTFLWIWSGQVVSLLGSSLTRFALGVWVYQQTGSVSSYALTFLVSVLPMLALAPIAGILVDRHDRRLVLVVSDAGGGAAMLALLLLAGSGRLEVWHVYVATFAGAAFTSLQWPALGAATTMLVPAGQLARAAGLTQAAEAFSMLLAPALAGLLYVRAGIVWLLAADVLSFAVGIGTLARVRIPSPPRSAAAAALGLAALAEEALYGVRFLRARPGLVALLCVFAGGNFLAGLSQPLIAPMLLRNASVDAYGLVASASGVGLLAGTLMVSVWGGARRRVLAIAVGEVASGLFSSLVGLTPSLRVAAVGLFGFDFFAPLAGTSSQALWQTKVAPEVQGRVFAIRRMVALSCQPLGYLLAGPLGDGVFEPLLRPGGALAGTLVGAILGVGAGRGTGLLLVVAGVLYAAVGSIAFFHPRIRRLESELPDAGR